MTPNEKTPLYARKNPNGQIEIVDCPYEWVPLNAHGCNISLPLYSEACTLSNGAPLCIGSVCAIFPCERVRNFSEGLI